MGRSTTERLRRADGGAGGANGHSLPQESLLLVMVAALVLCKAAVGHAQAPTGSHTMVAVDKTNRDGARALLVGQGCGRMSTHSAEHGAKRDRARPGE